MSAAPATAGPGLAHLGMKNRQRLNRVQGDQDSNQELLVLSLQGQRKAIDDALEWTEERRRAQPIRPPGSPTRNPSSSQS